MKVFVLITFLLVSFSSFSQDLSVTYKPNQSDLEKADEIARETAAWFHYTTGLMDTEHLGQCGDYAVMFILKYKEKKEPKKEAKKE